MYIATVASYKQMLTVYLFNQTVCVSARSVAEFSLQQQYLSLSSCIYAIMHFLDKLAWTCKAMTQVAINLKFFTNCV